MVGQLFQMSFKVTGSASSVLNDRSMHSWGKGKNWPTGAPPNLVDRVWNILTIFISQFSYHASQLTITPSLIFITRRILNWWSVFSDKLNTQTSTSKLMLIFLSHRSLDWNKCHFWDNVVTFTKNCLTHSIAKTTIQYYEAYNNMNHLMQKLESYAENTVFKNYTEKFYAHRLWSLHTTSCRSPRGWEVLVLEQECWACNQQCCGCGQDWTTLTAHHTTSVNTH